MTQAIKILIGDRIFDVKQDRIIEAFDIDNNQVMKIDGEGNPFFPNIILKAAELSNTGVVNDDGNYKYSIEESTGDLVVNYMANSVWNEVGRFSQLDGDEAFWLKNRGLIIGSPESTKDTELVVGLRGDSTVDGMSVLTSPDNATFTDVTEIASSNTGSTYPIFSNNPQVGAVDYFGWDFEFCNFKIKNATIATVDGSSVVVREYWNGSSWEPFPVMVYDSTTFEQRANNIGSVIGTEQVLFQCPIDFAKTTINGIEKFWVRFRVTGALLTSGTVEQVKVGTDRWECNKSGRTSYTGNAEYIKSLAIPFKSLFDLDGSIPGNADIDISTNIVFNGEGNLFSGNARDGKTSSFVIPIGLDTSKKINVAMSYFGNTSAVGDIEFSLYSAQVNTGDLLDGSLTEVSQSKIEPINNESAILKTVSFDIDVETLIPGEVLAFSIVRDASAGNPNDTYTGGVVVSGFTVDATFFTP